MEYKIIVLDLDGTLTNRDKVITPRTKRALMEAQEAGKIVVLLPAALRPALSLWQRNWNCQNMEAIFCPTMGE